MPGFIAIVGRPNVGKSALFNRIVGKRVAIVHDEPGVTRDRISAEAEWRGHPFTLVDTGGIGLVRGEKSTDSIMQSAIAQVEIAIEAANVIILVTNVREGVTPLDREVAERLRRSGKSVLVAVNKVDNANLEADMGEFARLGFDKLFPVSAIHGLGIEPLMDAAQACLPPDAPSPVAESGDAQDAGEGEAAPQTAQEPLKLAFIGRPNVGKSSLINALTRSDRVIVNSIPGTTRDAIDVPFEVDTEGVRENYILIDTAGVRQERRIDNSIEFYSLKRTEDSIARCDIAVLVLDAETGVTAQDKKVAGKIVAERKACVIIINKWDLLAEEVLEVREEEMGRRARKERHEGTEKRLSTLGEFGAWVQEQLFFLDYAPVIFGSAKSGFHLDRLLEAIRYIAAQLQQKVPTAILNRTLHDAIEERQPPTSAGHRFKFFYATQVRSAPPTFLLFVNRDDLLSDQYSKYLTSRMRRAFGFEGCPLILVAKPRPKTIESKGRAHPLPHATERKRPHGRAGGSRRPVGTPRRPRVQKQRRPG